MPRDKTDTHNKLLPCIRQEFMTYGYERASLKHIAENAGITAAGIYRHFPSKEAMFVAMVEPVTSEFLYKYSASIEEKCSGLSDRELLEYFGQFRAQKNVRVINYMYDHYDVFRLLLVYSKGTPYESFEDRLVELEMAHIREMFRILESRRMPHNRVEDEDLHILCTTFITAACEAIKHEYTRERALKHMGFVGELLNPGVKEVLGF